MKKRRIFSIFLACVIALANIFSTGFLLAANTQADDLGAVFEESCDQIYDSRVEVSNWQENQSFSNEEVFPTETIMYYTFRNVDSKYCSSYGEKVLHYEQYVPAYIKISTKGFENTAKKLFKNINVSALRKNFRYDKSAGGYLFSISEYTEGWGAFYDCFLLGYEEKQGIYTLYGYVGTYYVQEEHKKELKKNKSVFKEVKIGDSKYIYTGRSKDSGEEYFNISKKIIATVSYDGLNVKFHSWKTVEKLSVSKGDIVCNVHSYKTTTTKATLKKNGSIVKKCTICGKVASKKTIKYAKKFTLSTKNYTYNGKAKKPTVTVKDSSGKKLKKNTDYKVTYKDNKKVGKATVTVKLIGKYSGTEKLTFRINPAKTKISKLTAGKKSIKVAINKKSTQVTGYQIEYSTSKKFTKSKTKTISSYKTTKYTLKSLNAKKTYYVRVRTYKKVGKTKYYSGWSSYKKMKTK